MSNQRGYSVPAFLILLLLLVAVPVLYWVSTNDLSASSQDVRGASTTGSILAKPGFKISVSSKANTWDLVEFLCKSLEECTDSLTSGRRLGTVSGGAADMHEIVVEYTSEWDDYKYIKYFVRSGWYSQSQPFDVVDVGEIPGAEVYNISEGMQTYQTVIAPTSSLESSFYSSSHFSDF